MQRNFFSKLKKKKRLGGGQAILPAGLWNDMMDLRQGALSFPFLSILFPFPRSRSLLV